MVNKKKLVGILVLVFGMTIAGCEDDSTNNIGNDIWSGFTNFNSSMTGTWIGTFNQTRTIQQYNEDNSFETWNASKELLYGNMMVSSIDTIMMGFVVQTQSIGLITVTESYTSTFYGGNINTAWQTVKAVYGSGYTSSVDDVAHSISGTYILSSNQPITVDAYNTMNVQINHSSTKLKIPANAFGIRMPPSEMVFIKQ